MKFIRDIIGEKRQVHSELPATADFAKDLSEAREMEQATYQPERDAPPIASVPDHGHDTNDLTDEIAAFFAQEAADHADADSAGTEPDTEESVKDVALDMAPDFTPMAERTPTRFVAGPAASGNAPRESEAVSLPDSVPAPVSAAKRDITADIDRVLVPDHHPDPLIDETIRAARHMTEPRTPAPQADTASGLQSPDSPLRSQAIAPDQAFALTEEFRKPDEPTLAPEASSRPEPAPLADPSPAASIAVPQPAMGRGEARHGRVKTRLLGFDTSPDTGLDPMARQKQALAAPYTSFPVGWLIVVDGVGRGSAFTLFNGVSTIGRGEDQIVRLDFGDNAISRENHASIAYDPMGKSFFIGHGGKANLVRRNNRPVLSTEELTSGDHITIGETVLRFIPLCGPDFSWDTAAQGD